MDKEFIQSLKDRKDAFIKEFNSEKRSFAMQLAAEDLIIAFDQAVAALPVNEWIDVKDGLPENLEMFNDRVLFVCSGIVRNGCYDYESDDWTETGGGIYKNVTHWMPLPQPHNQMTAVILKLSP